VTVRLRLLDRVAWDDTTIPGERPAALLAALATHRSGLPDATLAELVWGDELPAHPTKALQVLVSRLRSVDRDLVTRGGAGYRLGAVDHPDMEVDAWALEDLVRQAQAALRDDRPDAAEPLAARALSTSVLPGGPGPLRELRAEAAASLRVAERVRALALARTARHTEALPLLRAVADVAPDDVEVLTELLRATARATGIPAALEHYERYRRDLAGRTGLDPDPELQRVHRELLAADAPVQTGVHHDPDELLGRDGDLARLRTALASGRLATILGPGGIGKTRTAHVLAREAPQPRVHFVELVGVTSGDDVVAEVGAALGVRGSVTARHGLTPAQQADVRARIAQELDSGPTLLVLDNCEHVLESVAGLVAFLLVTTRDLRVLTTSRAPLRIASERVVPLTQLAPVHAAALFRRRAEAVRPDAFLDPATVRAVVERLDGLPLAIELAAARIRTMSAEQVRDALADRFSLLRSRDRAAPERHRTLTAVIEWSWGLLSAREQDAAARLSVFHDGFDGAAARSVLGPDGMDLVEALADQSIVTVAETGGRTRFRMLETIREYAALRLAESGSRDDAVRRQEEWAWDVAEAEGSLFFSPDQVGAVDRLLVEENNLADVLRRALTRGDAALTATLMRTLGGLWTITGNHARFFAIADAAQDLLATHDPDPDDPAAVGAAFESATLLLIHLSWIPTRDVEDLRTALLRWGRPQHPWAKAARLIAASADGDTVAQIVAQAQAEVDPVAAAMLLMWAAINAENAGDVDAAVAYCERALSLGEPTPYLEAAAHSELSQLAMYHGDHRTAARHAEVAWPILLRLHAYDDAASVRLAMAIAQVLDGDLDAAEAAIHDVERLPEAGQLGSRMFVHAARAELALARGDLESGLAQYDQAVDGVNVELPGWPGGLTPWLLMAVSGALAARVRHSRGPDPRSEELRNLLMDNAPTGSEESTPLEDLPLGGALLVAVAAWQLRFGSPETHEAGVRLLAIGHRWAYSRAFPSLSWEPLAEIADAARPGMLESLLKTWADRPGRDLVPEALTLLASLDPGR
jgi:predicted ATPase